MACLQALINNRDDETGSLLDITNESGGNSIRHRLRSNNYASFQEVIDHLSQLKPEMIFSGHEDSAKKAQEFLTTMQTKVEQFDHIEARRQENFGRSTPSASEPIAGFPSRCTEPQVLVVTSLAGLLFSSAGRSKEFCVLSTPSVHLSRVLPVAPADARLLGDVRQDTAEIEQPDILSVRCEPLAVVRKLKRAAFESFGVQVDRGGTVLDDKISSCRMRSSKRGPGVTMEESGKSEAVPSEQAFAWDFGLLDEFEAGNGSSPDITACLLKLSNIQNSRCSGSPFLDPSPAEIALAQRITTMLQKQISVAGLTPKDLLGKAKYVDLTFPQLTPSFAGTLPPTIAQAIKATAYGRGLSVVHSPKNQTGVLPIPVRRAT